MRYQHTRLCCVGITEILTMSDRTIPEARADQWRAVERRLNEAGLVGYQRALVCRIFDDECCVAALDWIERVKEASDGSTD